MEERRERVLTPSAGAAATTSGDTPEVVGETCTVAQCHRDSGKREQRHIKMLNVAYGQSFSNKWGCSQMLETEVFKTTS